MKKGLTFIEILITVLILGLIAILLANILSNFNILFSQKTEERESISNLQTIVDKLTRDIRQGNQVLDISPPTQTLGYLVLSFPSGDQSTYSYSYYNGKYYFTVDGEILAGPIKEIRFMGLDDNLTYTTTPSAIRTLSISVTMDDDRYISTKVALRAQTIPKITGIFIREIMYYPAPRNRQGNSISENLMEFVVINNATYSSINLNGWKINGYTISNTLSGTYTVPAQGFAIIGARGSNLSTHYFIPNNYIILEVNNPYLGQNSHLGNNGDTIVLQDANNIVIDKVTYDSSWGGQPSGSRYYSLARKSIQNPSQDPSNWESSRFINYSLSNPRIDVYCLIPPIVINEIMYYPAPYGKNGRGRNKRDIEFIEIYNASNQPINIQNWRINNNVLSTLVSGNWNLSPGSYAVIGGSRSALNNYYNLAQNTTYIRVNSRGLGLSGAALPNNGSTITLADPNGLVFDQVNYSYTWGGYPSSSGNYMYYYSLERKYWNVDSNAPSNWGSSSNLNYSVFLHSVSCNVYCTPGGKNSNSP
ncbi:MAG: lamin tail domain-containing protein [Dictyoglomus thermophilum]|nr:lamin tail domain-containing protein [Dictyoglomus thermophilum]MCX7721044.1 lamin tail domain-containing protein [Dictyoglomus thermophilum]